MADRTKSGHSLADIVGSRNILVHQYFGIDLRQVWETAELDMPILKAKVRRSCKR
jgi:uncharacterized protein with HEPN domain